MTVLAVVGSQWGDEGKGRLVDELAARADFVVRYHGGANAGHRVVRDGEEFAFISCPLAFSTLVLPVSWATESWWTHALCSSRWRSSAGAVWM